MSYNLNNLFPKPSTYRSSPVADQRLAVANVAVQFSAFSDTSNMVMFDVQDNDVFATIDGSSPTTSNGHRLYNGRSYTWSTAMASAAKFIAATTSTAAAVHLSELQL